MAEKIQNLGYGEIEEIDIAYDNNSEGESELDFVLDMNRNGVICNRLEETGPAGGWPVYQLVPTCESASVFLRIWLMEEYCDGDEEFAEEFSDSLFCDCDE